ncbi:MULTISPECIES: UTP--glucose-1-phosphate uridylyltransferase [unclassified Pseudoclavibacter]|uniref:UTP--glucose-1-phosphate uridylyltransferase n=1 Tax=unclassified Pseudoclavibacter TaxID=2615177 RepID=UPI0013012510|nr:MULTISPECIES: UTP--glucose-1-phosphate uridylyltransferase [unclassified Pseudoclavibacter]KAB1647297.1 UTP--glucose-1-phosphate uridylyltransferase [Pseudoclavibacter sp. CFCC 14310]KAB1662710.1 UTP--glucose-1-phosphate uridylyltransferase [Pseudoclavibacter sp. CFCC 13611]
MTAENQGGTQQHRAVKAVVPVAGLGTRFLPATKAVPKEMLPVVDRPAIQYVLEEASGAGLSDVLLVTGSGKGAIEDHFDAAPYLESRLAADGKDALLASVREATGVADVHSVRQGVPRGLGHAVLCGREHVGDEPFAVLLGDDLIDADEDLLSRMLDVQAARGASVVALLEVPADRTHLYGVAEVEATGEADVVRITGLVEKPEPGTSPSNLAVIGRYVLQPGVFDVLARTAPGRGNEIQLTDALETLAADESIAGPVLGVVFRGRRFDTGDKLEYLKTVVTLASERDDLGPAFRTWLNDFSKTL